MRKMISIVLILVATLSSALHGGEPRLFPGASVTLVPASENLDGATGFDIHLDYVFHPFLMLKAAGGRFSTATKGVDDYLISGRLLEGDYTLTWIEASVLLTIETTVAKAYAGLGAGYNISDLEISQELQDYAAEVNNRRLTQDIDDIVVLHVRAGALAKLSPMVYLYVDAKYTFLNPTTNPSAESLDGTQLETSTSNVDLNTLQLNIGLSVGLWPAE
jgi:hypothetical protein